MRLLILALVVSCAGCTTRYIRIATDPDDAVVKVDGKKLPPDRRFIDDVGRGRGYLVEASAPGHKTLRLNLQQTWDSQCVVTWVVLGLVTLGPLLLMIPSCQSLPEDNYIFELEPLTNPGAPP